MFWLEIKCMDILEKKRKMYGYYYILPKINKCGQILLLIFIFILRLGGYGGGAWVWTLCFNIELGDIRDIGQ